MKFKIIFAPDVRHDIQDAIDWYNSQQAGIDKKLVNELKKYFNIIKKNPGSNAIRYENTRCCPLNKFPYMIHYRLDNEDNTIYIDAVFHTSRNPVIWKNR
jgi:plasmid stabilization system protein ParE